MRHFTTKEACRMIGISRAVLIQWENRYGWPSPVRRDNGYRLYSQMTIDDVRRFNAAGRPFDQIVNGTWCANPAQAEREEAIRPIVAAYDDIEDRWKDALQLRSFGIIAEYLASLGRMRPAVRAQYVRSAQEADRAMGGAIAHLLRRFGITKPTPPAGDERKNG